MEPEFGPGGADRSLPYRVIAAGALGGAVGWAIAGVIVTVLAHLTFKGVEGYERYVLPAWWAADLGRLTAWAPGKPDVFWRGSLLLLLALVMVLVFPFLFNRCWFTRAIFSWRHVLKVVALGVGSGVVQLMLAHLSGMSSASAAVAKIECAKKAAETIFSPGAAVAAGAVSAAFFLFAGELTLGGGPQSFRNPALSWRTASGACLMGFLFGVAVQPFLGISARDAQFVMCKGLDFIGEAALPSLLYFQRMQLALALAFGLCGGGYMALWVALSPSRAGARRRAIAVGLAALPLATLAIGSFAFHRRWDTRFATVAEAAGLEPAPPPRLLAAPTAQGPRTFVYPMEAVAESPTAHERIGATLANADRLRRYLDSRGGRWTLFTMRAWTGRAHILDRLLDPNGAARAELEAAERTGSVLMTMFAIARLGKTPLDGETRPLAEALLDPQRFTRGKTEARASHEDATGALTLWLLSAVATNVGRPGTARDLWSRALAEGFEPRAGGCAAAHRRGHRRPHPRRGPRRGPSPRGPVRLDSGQG